MMSTSPRFLVAVLATTLVAGCGVNKATHQKALDSLTACQNELEDTKKDRDTNAKKVAELEDELGITRTERDKKSQAELEKEARIKKLLSEMEENKQEVEQELLNLRKQRDQAEKRLAAYRELNEKFRSLVDTGKLEVAFRNGQMVIKMPSGVLFGSGRADLSKSGKEALTEVLDILLQFKDRRFQVAGHTDNVPIHSRKFRDNWYLSTARAVSVVEFMIQSGFAPENLSATGFGAFDPIGDNSTAEGRALNRRIEIILVPDLSELPNLTAEPQ